MPISYTPFKREDHVYLDDRIADILKDAIAFFNGTPIVQMPPPVKFAGAGVYAIYCRAKTGIYSPYGTHINSLAWNAPIYVGKAIPEGWRMSRIFSKTTTGSSLYNRLCQHSESISSCKSLNISDFACRFAIFEGGASEIIPVIEAALISLHSPLWNSVIDGFGNHDPGGKRYGGKKTQWDSLHPGRAWASKMTGESYDPKELTRRVKDYLLAKAKK